MGLSLFVKFVLLMFTVAHLATGLAMVFFTFDWPLGLTGTSAFGADLPPHTVHNFGVRQAAIGVPMLIAFLFDDKKAAITALGGFVTRCYLDIVSKFLDDMPLAPPLEQMGAPDQMGKMAYPMSFAMTGTLALIALIICFKDLKGEGKSMM